MATFTVICLAALILGVIALLAGFFRSLLPSLRKVAEIEAILHAMETQPWEIGKFAVYREEDRVQCRADSTRLPSKTVVQKLRLKGWTVDPAPRKRGVGILADIEREAVMVGSTRSVSFLKRALFILGLRVGFESAEKDTFAFLALLLLQANQILGVRGKDIEARKYRENRPEVESSRLWAHHDEPPDEGQEVWLGDDGELSAVSSHTER